MSQRPFIWIGAFVGSTIGGMIPSLWGAGFISLSGIIFTGVGAAAGIWLGWRLSEY